MHELHNIFLCTVMKWWRWRLSKGGDVAQVHKSSVRGTQEPGVDSSPKSPSLSPSLTIGKKLYLSYVWGVKDKWKIRIVLQWLCLIVTVKYFKSPKFQGRVRFYKFIFKSPQLILTPTHSLVRYTPVFLHSNPLPLILIRNGSEEINN